MIVKLQVQMMRLKVGENKNTRDRAGEFTEALEDVLRHERHTLLKLLTVNLRASTHSGALFPRAWRIRIEWPARPELTLGESLHCRAHVWVMRRAITLVDTGQAGRVRERPSLIRVVTETQPWHLRVAAGAQYNMAVYAIEQPAANPIACSINIPA